MNSSQLLLRIIISNDDIHTIAHLTRHEDDDFEEVTVVSYMLEEDEEDEELIEENDELTVISFYSEFEEEEEGDSFDEQTVLDDDSYWEEETIDYDSEETMDEITDSPKETSNCQWKEDLIDPSGNKSCNDSGVCMEKLDGEFCPGSRQNQANAFFCDKSVHDEKVDSISLLTVESMWNLDSRDDGNESSHDSSTREPASDSEDDTTSRTFIQRRPREIYWEPPDHVIFLMADSSTAHPGETWHMRWILLISEKGQTCYKVFRTKVVDGLTKAKKTVKAKRGGIHITKL